MLDMNCYNNNVSSYDVYNLLKDSLKYKVIDKYFKGLGFLTNDNIFIPTNEFNYSKYDLKIVNYNKLPRINYKKYFDNLTNINKLIIQKKLKPIKLLKYAVNSEDFVNGFITDSNMYIPIDIEKLEEKHKEIIDIFETYNNIDNIDNILYSKNKDIDEGQNI